MTHGSLNDGKARALRWDSYRMPWFMSSTTAAHPDRSPATHDRRSWRNRSAPFPRRLPVPAGRSHGHDRRLRERRRAPAPRNPVVQVVESDVFRSRDGACPRGWPGDGSAPPRGPLVTASPTEVTSEDPPCRHPSRPRSRQPGRLRAEARRPVGIVSETGGRAVSAFAALRGVLLRGHAGPGMSTDEIMALT